jgi:hypothetical protein
MRIMKKFNNWTFHPILMRSKSNEITEKTVLYTLIK